MVQFHDWCDVADSTVGAHGLRILSGDPVRLNAGVTATAAVVPTHYAAAERVAGILRRLGKPEAAKFVEGKLPTSKAIRSGDLGEILATEWIAAQGSYQVPIKRLRWKDHRNMAMRGDDVIGIQQNPQSLSWIIVRHGKGVAASAALTPNGGKRAHSGSGTPNLCSVGGIG